MRHHFEKLFEHAGLGFAGRHSHGPRGGLGRFGGGFMDEGGPGGRGMRMGRRLGSADLQLLVLSLLADKPRHGYEIIKALEERSKGFYTPSPGMVYPALTYLEEIGYATIEADGARKLYHITEAGQAHLVENREAADTMFGHFERIGEKMDRVRRAFSGEASGDAEPADTGLGRGGSKELLQARRDLKVALSTVGNSSPQDQRRVAEILQRAAEEIRSKSTPRS